MALDIVDLRGFYASPLGRVSRRLLGRAVRQLWPNLRGFSLAGIGYATPCLAGYRGEAERVFALMPANQGVVKWPSEGMSATALVHPGQLPLSNASVDRVLLQHVVENLTDPLELLDEVWRVLAPGGRLITIVPNRRGLWARRDVTPFGHGQPFSRGQLAQLMRQALFTPEHWSEALFIPPSQSRVVLRAANVIERVGDKLAFPFAGAHLLEATKQLFRPAMARPARRGFLIGTPAPVASRQLTWPPNSPARTVT